MADSQVPAPESGESIDETRGERLSFADASRQEEARASEFRRREQFRNVVHRGAVWMALLAPYLLAIFVIVMGWHYLGPERWTWMSAEQIGQGGSGGQRRNLLGDFLLSEEIRLA